MPNMKTEGYLKNKEGKTWYEIYGGNKTKPPLLVVHGGPGFPHDYLQPLAKLADERQIIFYDQLGCGKSDRLPNNDHWTLEFFVEELDSLIKHLSLDKFHLLGHSWGAMLATEYCLEKKIKPLSLILASPLISTPLWISEMKRLINKLSPSTRKIILDNDKNNIDSSKYESATDEFYNRHFFRGKKEPQAIVRARAKHGEGVYLTMWGDEEFRPTGNLKSTDLTSRLSELNIPVLLTGGRFDEATPESLQTLAALIKNSQIKVFEKSAHFPHLEEKDDYLQTLRKFLKP